MWKRAHLLVGCASAAFLAACTFLVDTTGLQGTAPTDPDAAAAVDSGMADGASTADGGTDASTPLCKSRQDASLCLDFDDGKAVSEIFTSNLGSNAQITAVVSKTDPFSPPGCLVLGWPGGPLGNPYLENVQIRPVPGLFQGALHFELRLRVDHSEKAMTRAWNLELKKGSERLVFEMSVTGASANAGTEREPANGGASVFDVEELSVAPLNGKWSKIALDIADGSATLSVDDRVARSAMAVEMSTFAGAAVFLNLSIQYYVPADLAKTEHAYDDVLVEVK